MPKSAAAGGLYFSVKSLAGDGVSSRMLAASSPAPEGGVILSHLIEITTCLDAKTGRVFSGLGVARKLQYGTTDEVARNGAL